MRSFALLLPLAILCAACDPKPPAATTSSSDVTPPPPSSASPSAPADTTPPADATPPGPAVAPPAPGELGGLARSNNALAFDLYARARAQAGNLALSPISISTALTMTWGGARGETAAQMKKVLHA